ncbi:hypothetical protein D5P88_25445 [Salmonella enterica subsp. enterica]|nr:hypothetical protein [Salmonella enterica subsp. enterica]
MHIPLTEVFIMGGLNEVINAVPLSLTGSLFGLWFLAWVMGLLSAHLLRSVIDIFKSSVDD